jgi:hypothetical protein
MFMANPFGGVVGELAILSMMKKSTRPCICLALKARKTQRQTRSFPHRFLKAERKVAALGSAGTFHSPNLLRYHKRILRRGKYVRTHLHCLLDPPRR